MISATLDINVHTLQLVKYTEYTLLSLHSFFCEWMGH